MPGYQSSTVTPRAAAGCDKAFRSSTSPSVEGGER